MIARGIFALAFVWLCTPHEPDLGLPAMTAHQGCTMADPCLTDFLTSTSRDAILKRLGEVKAEIDAVRAPGGGVQPIDGSSIGGAR